MKSKHLQRCQPAAWAAIALLGLSLATARAETTGYAVMGENLVHLQDPRGTNLTLPGYTDVMARLRKNLGYEGLVSAIIAASPSVTDEGVGRAITADDFSDAGRFGVRATWYGAQALMRYLNSIAYAGSTRWRLPTAVEMNKIGFEDNNPFKAGFLFKLSTASSRADTTIWVDAAAPAGAAIVRRAGSAFTSSKGTPRDVVAVSPGLAPTVPLWNEERVETYQPEQTVVLDGTDGTTMRAYRCKPLPEGDGCKATAYRPAALYGGHAWTRLGF